MYSNFLPTFSLDNFEGPLELLLYLIQKEEIDICAIALKKLTTQFMQSLEASPEVESSSELLTLAATLLLLKSQKLIPEEGEASEMEEDPRVEMIQSLIEYCRLKDAAKTLLVKEEEQKAHFPRATSPFRKELGTGLEEIEIENLRVLLSDMLKRSGQATHIIKDEEFQVSDKLLWLRSLIAHKPKLHFLEIFSEGKQQAEIIVLFLALLEMMKRQEARLVKENEEVYIIYYVPRT